MPLMPPGFREDNPDVKNKKPCLVDVTYQDGEHETFDCIGMVVVGDVFKRRSDGVFYVVDEFDLVREPCAEESPEGEGPFTLIAKAVIASTPRDAMST